MDQFLAKRVMLARILHVLEENAQVLREIFRRVHAPREQVLQCGDAAVAALGELGFAHREILFFSSAITSAACANSAPRSIRPAQRSRAWRIFSVTTTPLITETPASSATRCIACVVASAISS